MPERQACPMLNKRLGSREPDRAIATAVAVSCAALHYRERESDPHGNKKTCLKQSTERASKCGGGRS